jgi:hypothetical protein
MPIKQLTEQLNIKQARLQWLFNNNMKCDEYVTWGACLVGDTSTLKWLVEDKKCKVDERYQSVVLDRHIAFAMYSELRFSFVHTSYTLQY